MTDASHATPGPLPPPPHRSHGCLWGCLIAAVIFIAAVVGILSYTGWYFYSGFKDNPALKTVMTSVNGDQIARSVLGDHIEITNIESSSFNSDLNTGTTNSYVAHLKGSKGEGTLAVTIHTHNGQTSVTQLILTGPTGQKYDLNHPNPAPPPDSI